MSFIVCACPYKPKKYLRVGVFTCQQISVQWGWLPIRTFTADSMNHYEPLRVAHTSHLSSLLQSEKSTSFSTHEGVKKKALTGQVMTCTGTCAFFRLSTPLHCSFSCHLLSIFPVASAAASCLGSPFASNPPCICVYNSTGIWVAANHCDSLVHTAQSSTWTLFLALHLYNTETAPIIAQPRWVL